MYTSKKNPLYVLFEALILGILLVLMVRILQVTTKFKNMEIIFISIFTLHLIFEYSGLNIWYSKNYCRML